MDISVKKYIEEFERISRKLIVDNEFMPHAEVR